MIRFNGRAELPFTEVRQCEEEQLGGKVRDLVVRVLNLRLNIVRWIWQSGEQEKAKWRQSVKGSFWIVCF